ncbi:sensor histidine kinase [Afipia carboxidovorans]|uniref:sensor histidine kinase n=1 Tax=Afipia carboxidovorans TaxID=40137 RepID=UPI00309066EA|nr:HWE histidine kinase domain-containing protein [Afipia carboxidovorans]
MRRMSLVSRLLSLVLVACLPGLAALIYSSIDLRNTRYHDVNAEALRNAHFAVSELDQVFEGIKGVLHAVGQAAEVRGNDVAQCQQYLTRVRAQLAPLTSIVILDRDGYSRCFSEGAVPTVSLSDRYYFQEALATRQFSVGDYTPSRLSNRKIVPVALPAVTGDHVDFIVAAGINLEWLGRQLRERGLARGSAVTVADRNGIILAREPNPERFIGTTFPTQYMYLLSEEPGTADIRSRDGIRRVVGYVPAPYTPFGLYVSSGIARTEAFGPVDRALRSSIMLFVLGSAAAFVLAWLVGNSIIRRPLMQMVETAESWRRGDDSVRNHLDGRNDEIGVLGQTFDRLMDENARREEERELSEARREILVHELAHRVKNTLATVQSIATMSFRNNQGPEALRGFQERLQALVRSHDLLTRHNWQHADLREVAEAALAPAREDLAHRFTLSGPPVDLRSAIVVPIAMIFHELCTNSLKYGALCNDTGHVEVRWTKQPDERGNLINLIWSEHGGPPVKPPEREGFGTRLLTSLTRQMGGSYEMNYAASGVVCDICLVTRADNVAAESEPASD